MPLATLPPTHMNNLILTTVGLLAGLTLLRWWLKQQQEETPATDNNYSCCLLPAFPSHYLQNRRDITVLLPPNYEQERRYYPVLYLNDGQDLAQWGLVKTVERLLKCRQIPPLIVVVIPTNGNRLQEYGTAIAPNAQGMGTEAKAYADFVIKEVMPAINNHFRIRPSAEYAGILGASLGGLSAFDIAWQNRDKFGIVGVMSGSFWWRAGAEESKIPPNRLIAHQLVQQGSYQPNFRAWFEAGTNDEEDDRDNNGVIDAIQDTVELIELLDGLGYKQPQEIFYFQVEDGEHNYETWRRILPAFLCWAYGRYA